MKYYELIYHLSPELKTEEIEKITEELISFIQKEGGDIVRSENPIHKTLAYPIKKQKTSFLGSLDFYLAPEKMNDLKEKIRKIEQILRFFLISKKIPKKIPVKKEIPLVTVKEPKPKKEKPEKKVELKEIEKKLEEILGE